MFVAELLMMLLLTGLTSSKRFQRFTITSLRHSRNPVQDSIPEFTSEYYESSMLSWASSGRQDTADRVEDAFNMLMKRSVPSNEMW